MSKILVVDDDIDILDGIEVYLKRKKLNVVSLSDCRKVTQTVQSERPDLILLDIKLGICDGRQLCLQLKNRYRYTQPILLFSSSPELGDTVYEYQADDFILKPFSIQEFYTTIQEHLWR